MHESNSEEVNLACFHILNTYLICRRSEYFKTAIDTAVGEKKKLIDVKECTHYVLAIIIDFIYGTEIPDDLTQETGESLLVMADLYLMQDLEEAVSIPLAKHLSLDNVFQLRS